MSVLTHHVPWGKKVNLLFTFWLTDVHNLLSFLYPNFCILGYDHSIFQLVGKKNKQKSSKEKLKELMEFVGVNEKRKVVDITRKVGTAETLSESVIHCGLEEKDAYLYYFIKSHKVGETNTQ